MKTAISPNQSNSSLSKSNIIDLDFLNLKDYSQKHFCENVCVWFCDFRDHLKITSENLLQTIIYTRGHKEDFKTKSLNYVCGFFNTKNKLRLILYLVNTKFSGGEL